MFNFTHVAVAINSQFIHSLNKHLLSTSYMPGTVFSAGVTTSVRAGIELIV